MIFSVQPKELRNIMQKRERGREREARLRGCCEIRREICEALEGTRVRESEAEKERKKARRQGE